MFDAHLICKRSNSGALLRSHSEPLTRTHTPTYTAVEVGQNSSQDYTAEEDAVSMGTREIQLPIAPKEHELCK